MKKSTFILMQNFWLQGFAESWKLSHLAVIKLYSWVYFEGNIIASRALMLIWAVDAFRFCPSKAKQGFSSLKALVVDARVSHQIDY